MKFDWDLGLNNQPVSFQVVITEDGKTKSLSECSLDELRDKHQVDINVIYTISGSIRYDKKLKIKLSHNGVLFDVSELPVEWNWRGEAPSCDVIEVSKYPGINKAFSEFGRWIDITHHYLRSYDVNGLPHSAPEEVYNQETFISYIQAVAECNPAQRGYDLGCLLTRLYGSSLLHHKWGLTGSRASNFNEFYSLQSELFGRIAAHIEYLRHAHDLDYISPPLSQDDLNTDIHDLAVHCGNENDFDSPIEYAHEFIKLVSQKMLD